MSELVAPPLGQLRKMPQITHPETPPNSRFFIRPIGKNKYTLKRNESFYILPGGHATKSGGDEIPFPPDEYCFLLPVLFKDWSHIVPSSAWSTQNMATLISIIAQTEWQAEADREGATADEIRKAKALKESWKRWGLRQELVEYGSGPKRRLMNAGLAAVQNNLFRPISGVSRDHSVL